MRKILFKSLAILIVLMLSSIPAVLAVSSSDLNKVNNQINETKENLESITSEKSSMLKQVETIMGEISEYENKIDELENEIEELKEEIEEKTEEIAVKQELYDENYEKLISRLVASYEAGNTTYIDVILTSKNITDILSNWYYLTEIAEADVNFLEVVQKQKQDLELEKVSIESSKEKVELNKENLEKTKSSLEGAKNTKQKYVNQLSSEEKEVKDQLEQFEKDKKAIQTELARLASQNNYSVVSASQCGYIFPVQGLGKGNINVISYPSYPGHTGTDVNINVVGKNVVAVKSGTVVISRAYKTSGGVYYSYGECIAIDHHDGTVTLYGHMLAGSRTVSVGQTVSQGQVLGIVGSTGNSTGPHLHFEVRVNGRAVNPIPYLP